MVHNESITISQSQYKSFTMRVKLIQQSNNYTYQQVISFGLLGFFFLIISWALKVICYWYVVRCFFNLYWSCFLLKQIYSLPNQSLAKVPCVYFSFFSFFQELYCPTPGDWYFSFLCFSVEHHSINIDKLQIFIVKLVWSLINNSN